MNNIQYTIRAVPSKLDQTLRLKAKKTGKSLNEVVLESLAKGSGVDSSSQTFHDLDWFIGSMEQDPNIDEALNWLDASPKELQ